MKVSVFFIDLFALTLLVYLVLTVLAFSSLSESQEKTLPTVTLTGAKDNKRGTSDITPLALSARRGGQESVQYFVEDKEVVWAKLPGLIKSLAPLSVVLRVDEALPTRIAIRLMALLDNLKITNITFAYRAP